MGRYKQKSDGKGSLKFNSKLDKQILSLFVSRLVLLFLTVIKER